ncbi:family 43 glycosylhydrolase (plasmid) [Novosphingobium resinovorum]|uniref:family 43 glycosylhydrolase n=1 Tax=Novosphingobium TaxID=165696 RepID=UPI001B3C6457|nr:MULTISPECIES: family 43 glycosylhydrolase [Novosphingobium]MBF7015686.1 family 43 glycosylhydrolase [Novosphingobium sp. HR1a]WJM29678.1 family 43 glycosylhydrolase [Novosphingobium resinovorum]
MPSRRESLLLLAAGGAIAAQPAIGMSSASNSGNSAGKGGKDDPKPLQKWGKGIEGQRRADLGDGRFLNPVLAGDYPDPTVLKDGEDYYMTHSSFDASPGLVIWHSRDLVNWTPIGSALPKPLGTVFAVDLVKHEGRYYIYIPFMKAPWSRDLKNFANIYVIHADSMQGPWSEPIDLGIGGLIDPGHVVGEDGERYLFLSGINRVKLRRDGLSTDGKVEKVYDGWKYPDDWITEAYSLEGPKLLRRGDWFYIISAVGGTGGPVTGHMVIVARSRSVNGPWENCPQNPIVRTTDVAEQWWSRGHATAVEGPRGLWYLVYHGYENGYRTLGRQTLLEPIEWTADGWPRAVGGDLSRPMPKPLVGQTASHGIARSDTFATAAMGIRWTFFSASPEEASRASFGKDGLILQGKGTDVHDCSPLAQMVGDRAYEISVEMELRGEVQGGLLLFFNDRMFLGMGHDGTKMTTYRGGKAAYWQEPAPATRRLHLKIVNENNIVTFYYSADGRDWTRHYVRSETSGYHANTMDDLVSLRPALFAAGSGSVRFRNFTYRAL